MTKKIIPIFILFALLLTACGSAGEKTATTEEGKKTEETAEKSESAFTVKIDGKDTKFAPTSGWTSHWEKTFQYPKEGETENTIKEKSAHTEIYLANYELETKDGKASLMQQKIEKSEQIKVEFAINGEKGTDSETPIKVGKYEVNDDPFNLSKAFGKVDSVEIYHFVDGKQKKSSLSDSKLKGSVEITEVKDNTIKGKIDVTDGKHSIKGNFTAKGDNTVK